ncbi:MAG: DNA primase [Candidatus Zixiibacteriota bacterium]
MTGIIPQEIVDQVRDASDIVQVIGEYIRLKKRGRNYLALCPFHTEKTPSFSVSQDKQIFHCFGCGKGGNVYTFLMEHENLSFVETVKLLAVKAGIRVPERKVSDAHREEIEKLHYAHELALKYFRAVLNSSKYKESIVKRYLIENRKITEESIEFFSLGLAGEEWDGFLNYAVKKDLFPKDLLQAGLVSYSQSKNKYFDRFRQRLIIPIFNLSEKPIAFGGRTLKKGEQAKYVNSPETPLYNKSNVLYGLNFSKQFIREKNEVIIVEGYFDLISLYQAGIKNVVASSGTAFTAQQARLLARFTDMAFLFFDADSAGQAAALRSVDALYDAGIEVKVMVPPSGEDPDSMAVKEGGGGIELIKEKAMRFLEFRTRNIDMSNIGIIEKEKLIKELAELAGRINDETRRRLFITEAASEIQVDEDHFYRIKPISKSSSTDSRKPIAAIKKGTDFEGELISLMLSFPDSIGGIGKKIAPDDFHNEKYIKLFQFMLDIYQIHGAIDLKSIIDLTEHSDMKAEIVRLGQLEWNKEKSAQIIEDYMTKIIGAKREKIVERLKHELKKAEDNNDSKLAEQLAEEIGSLIGQRKK